MSNVPWTHKPVAPMTAKKAYGMGWTASKNTQTYDLGNAEARFERRYGSKFSGDFSDGWTDYAADKPRKKFP